MSRPQGARKGARKWHRNACAWALRSCLVACCAAPFVPADTASAKDPKDPEDPERDVTGPLSISRAARARVRGDRPERASIHAAWTPPAHDPDRSDREALAQFERETLPPTIVEVAPEPWMTKLAKPDLPVRWNKGTVEYLRYFKDDPRGKAMMRAWLRRAGRYQAKMQAILREHGVPEDLVWVVLAESGFNPRVRSGVGAAGPWQFMDGTAGVYGLAKDHWIDERFDIERSTHAAAVYLADLETRFGSWELALAAYNGGYGLVMTAIERHNTNNFWALCEMESGLPHATVNYVPKIVAAALVARNREVFDMTAADVQALPPIDWTVIDAPRSIRLASLARELDVDADLLAELNAQLVRGRTPPKRTTKVRVPKAAKSRASGAVAALKSEWSSESSYAVREGDRLAAIAEAHGITEKQLRRDNGILDAAEVRRGVVLVVPAAGSKVASRPAAEASERPLAAVPHVSPGKDERLVFFTATRSSTPSSIAAAFAVPWAKVVAWNDLDPRARVQPGQVLQIVVPRKFDGTKQGVVVHEQNEVELVERGSKEHIEAALARRGKERRAVKAKKGDTLAKIGKRFDLTDGDLARINGYGRDHELAPGEIVVVYVQDGTTRGTVDAPAPRASAGRDDGLAGRDAAVTGRETAERDDDEPTPATANAEPTARKAAAASDRASTKARKATRRERKRRDASTLSTSRVPGHRTEPP